MAERLRHSFVGKLLENLSQFAQKMQTSERARGKPILDEEALRKAIEKRITDAQKPEVAKDVKQSSANVVSELRQGAPENRSVHRNKLQQEAYASEQLPQSFELLRLTKDVLVKSGKPIPAWLNIDAIKHNPAVAEFAVHIATLPDALQSDPRVIYRELSKMHFATDWLSLTDEGYRETLDLVNAGLNEVSSASDGFKIDKNRFIAEIDTRPDIYRTHRLDPVAEAGEEPKQGQDQPDADYEAELKIWQQEKKKELQHKQLEATLRHYQNELDKSANFSLRRQKELLDSLDNELHQGPTRLGTFDRQLGARITRFSEADSDRYSTRVAERIAALERATDQQATARADAVTSERMKELRQKLSDMNEQYVKYSGDPLWLELVALRDETLAGVANPRMPEQLLKQYYERLDALQGRINDRGGDLARDVKEYFATLNSILGSGIAERTGSRHDFWLEAGEKYREYLINLGRNGTRDPNGRYGLSKETLDKLDEAIFDLWSLPDKQMNDRFRGAFGIYNEASNETFYNWVGNGMREMGITGENINSLMVRYARLRHVKETMHDVVFLGKFVGYAELKKFLQTYSTADTHDMFSEFPELQIMFSFQMREFQKLRANYGNYLPPAEFDIDTNLGTSPVIYRASQNFKEYAKTSGDKRLEGIREWKTKMLENFAEGFGIISAVGPDELSKGYPGIDFSSVPYRGLVVGWDTFRHLLVQFNIGEAGYYTLLEHVSDDPEFAARARGKPVAEIEQMMHEAVMADPDAFERYIDMQNLFELSPRLGPDSLWGPRRSMTGMPSELRERLGFSIRLAMARGQVESALQETWVADHERVHGKFHTDADKGRWLDKQTHERHHEIEHKLIAETRTILRKAMGISPVALLRHTVTDPYWKRVRFEIFTDSKLVGTEHLDAIRDIAINPNTGAHAGSYWDLLEVRGEYSKSTPNFPDAVKRRVDNAWNGFISEVNMIESAAERVEQYALQRRLSNYSLPTDRLEAGDLAILDDSPELQEKVRYFFEKTQQTLTTEQRRVVSTKSGDKELVGSYIDRLAERFAQGKERRLITTADVPWHLMDYKKWGPDAWVRRFNDRDAMAEAFEKGLVPFFRDYFVASPNHEKMAQHLKTFVYNPTGNYDNRVAQRIAYFLEDRKLRFYSEPTWAKYSGFIGDIALLIPAIGKNQTLVKKMYGIEGKTMGTLAMNRDIELLQGLGILGPEDFFYGFGAGHPASAHALKDKYGAHYKNIILAGIPYVFTVVPFGMMYLALSESVKKKEEGH